MGRHKIISDGKIIAVAVGKTKNSWLLTPDIGSVSKDVLRRPVSLKNKDSALRRISVDKPKWWSKWWSDP
jgi:hypothetical protein